jgi:hypothetical protein
LKAFEPAFIVNAIEAVTNIVQTTSALNQSLLKIS